MNKIGSKVLVGVFLFVVASFFGVSNSSVAYATHSWGGYHWARTANPFTLKLGDNLSSNWKPYLGTTSNDWSRSDILDTNIVPGQANRNCGPASGRVEVCNKAYGNNGWLGLAQIWVSGSHITQGVTKVNDTYFNTTTYNTPGWKNLVMCQEVGHTLGLNHQDENFSNTNLGTCMDYTSNPLGPPSNEHPNLHDYNQLKTIYTHLDLITTVGQGISTKNGKAKIADDVEDSKEWGKEVKRKGKIAIYERDFGSGNKLFTFVIYAN